MFTTDIENRRNTLWCTTLCLDVCKFMGMKEEQISHPRRTRTPASPRVVRLAGMHMTHKTKSSQPPDCRLSSGCQPLKAAPEILAKPVQPDEPDSI